MKLEERVERLERAVTMMAKELARGRLGGSGDGVVYVHALARDVYEAVALFASGGPEAEARAASLRAHAKGLRGKAANALTAPSAAKSGDFMAALRERHDRESDAYWREHHASEAEALADVYDGGTKP